MVRSQLRHRLGRAVALMSGIAVATSAFTVLTGAARTQELQVKGTVEANSRSAYDILVRPVDGRSATEQQRGLVQAGFMSGIYGGITLDQWHRIQQVPGVLVAAPLALVGYTTPLVSTQVDLVPQIPAGQDGALFKVTATTRTDGGLSAFPAATTYQYVTRNDMVTRTGGGQGGGTLEELPDGTRVEACPERKAGAGSKPFAPAPTVECSSAGAWTWTANGVDISRTEGTGRAGYLASIPTPLLIGAVDPASEAALDGLDGTVTSGRYLADHQPAGTREVRAAETSPDGTTVAKTLTSTTFPVLAAARSDLDSTLDITVERLDGAGGRNPAQLGEDAMAGLTGPRVAERRITAGEAYDQALREALDKKAGSFRDNAPLVTFSSGQIEWSTGPGGALAPAEVHNPDDTWAMRNSNVPWYQVPPSNADTALRPVRPHPAQGQDMPAPDVVGVYDPGKLAPTNPLTAVPLGVFDAPGTTGADDAARQALGGKPLRPDGNMAGLLTQPPQLLTTLDALPAITGGAYEGQMHFRDPISSVRVKVDGVTGTDPVSRERVRLVAEQIQQSTGLLVDVTYGSSPRPVDIALPPGGYGRPALALTQNWVKLGVAFTVLDALDRKSLTLFVLILAVCALFVANSVAAAVRSRRTELGVLSCLGWTAGRIGATLLGEVALLGLTAGLAGAALAWPTARLFGLHATLPRAALAVPGAVLLALLAGAVPVLRAARAVPAEAVRPAVSDPRRARRGRGLLGLAAGNLRRTPGRSLLGVLSVAIGSSALTVLLGVTWTFRNSLVGSLLGQAVSFRIRGIDYAAVGTVLVLGALAVADVLYLGIRERAGEFAALAASGWRDGELGRLVLAEGTLLGLAGALGGAAVGTAATAALAGRLPAVLLATAGAVAVGAVLVTVLAALVPAALLRRIPLGRLLTED
ncbi:FtsX-like permease family protein [Kitasatospora sp. NPDC057198]|uniref:FtsX-like permease family protein n=1 Tax=Kitasatospora sp. NPDC057198 TaxID=3346046 RepID=UPI00362F00FA